MVLNTSKMQRSKALAAMGFVAYLASLSSAAVTPSSQFITIANPDDSVANISSNLSTNLTADPDVQISGQYLPQRS